MLISLITSKERAPLQQSRLAPSLELEGKAQELLLEYDEILLDRFILLYFSYYLIKKLISKSFLLDKITHRSNILIVFQ